MRHKLVCAILSFAILLNPVLPLQKAFAHDYTVPGGDPPETPDPPKDDDPPPCDPAPPDTCPINNSPSTNSNKEKCTGGEPVYLFDGSFYYRHTDLIIPGKIPIVIRRAYDTRIEFKGLFGYGWSLNYHIRLFVLSNGNRLVKHGDNSKTEFLPDGENTYRPEKGYEVITTHADGTSTLEDADGYSYEFDLNGCLESISDKNGNELLFTYAETDEIKDLLPYSSISPYALIDTPIIIGYDFQLIRVAESHEGTLTGRYADFDYNANGRIIEIEDSAGRKVTYEYSADQKGDLVRMFDPEGNMYEYAYDDNHLMTSLVGLGCGDCTLHENTYNEDKQVIRQKHGNGITEFEYLPANRTKVSTHIYDDQTSQLLHTRYEYYDFNSEGYTLKHTQQVGSELDEEPASTEDDDVVWSYVYEANGNVQSQTNPQGVTTEYTYDVQTGNLLTEKVNVPDSTDYVLTEYAYDSAHNKYTSITITSTYDPQTYKTEYTYDANGNSATETKYSDSDDPATAITTRYTYDENGNILTATDPVGNVTTREYDSYGNLSRVYDPNYPVRQTLYTYDTVGNMLSTNDARGNTTSFEYDDLGRITKITDPLGSQTVNTYAGPNLVQIEEGKTDTEDGRITIIEYDGLNRKTAVKMLDDLSSEVTLLTYTYDSEGRILTTTDGNGNTTINTYDELGRLISLTNPNGFATTYVYDKAGNVIQATDAEFNNTYYNYDYANRLIDVTDALTNTTSYTYNALGNILTVTDARINTTTHTYDDAGRLIQVVDPNTNTTQYAYDKNSNMTEKITPNEYADPGGVDPIVYTYDKYNQLSQIDYPDGKTVTSAYDDAGNMTGWDDGALSGSTIYDELNHPLQATTSYPAFSKSVSYTYNRFGQRDAMTDGEGQITYYNYNNLGRLTSIDHPGSLTTSYVYDAAGRLTEKTLPNGVVTSYTYDVSSRLTDLANTAPGPVTISSYSYTYDNVGNRLTMATLEGTHNYGYDDIYQLTSATHPSQPAESYTYDPVGNRLTSANYSDWAYDNSNRLLSYDSTTFTYDENGNTISKTDASSTTTYTYDYENRLVVAITPSHTATYTYDPFGVRLGKTVDANAVWFLYDNEDIVAEYDSSGLLVAKYYHGQGIDVPIAMVKNNQTYYHIFDGLGSVLYLTDTNCNIVENYTYDTFGNLTGLPATGNLYAYTSREYDLETGSYFYRARYYDSTLGRFITADPIGFAGGINFYAYVNNNPVIKIDPFGNRIADILKAITVVKCLLEIWEWQKYCKERVPNCNDPCMDIWEYINCLEKSRKAIGECALAAKKMFKACMSAAY